LNISLGQVVYSKAGRDKGKKMLVINIVDESHLLLADGDLRKIEKPKVKKIKHLELTEEVIIPLSDKLKSKLKVSNSDIRKALAAKENMQQPDSKVVE
jgi:large subunit ribosomal protein L14e